MAESSERSGLAGNHPISMLQRFSALGGTCWLVPRCEYTSFVALQRHAVRLPQREALLAVRDWKAGASPWSHDPGATPSDGALEDLADAIAEDRVRVYEQHPLLFLNTSPMEAMDLLDLLGPQAPEQVSHWVEVRLVYENGEPRAGERYRAVLGDDSEVEGQLDPDGVARLPGLPAGPCQWFFPDLAPGEWSRA